MKHQLRVQFVGDELPPFVEREYLAERIRVAAGRDMLLEGIHTDALLTYRVDINTQRLVGQLVSYVLGVKKHESQFEQVPRDWWQHFRQRWMPEFWLRRHPVRMRLIEKTVIWERICPHTRVPQESTHLRWLAGTAS